jgi:hypothetical protein
MLLERIVCRTGFKGGGEGVEERSRDSLELDSFTLDSLIPAKYIAQNWRRELEIKKIVIYYTS